ncbi:hypothetical protein PoB_003107800 [Plakobranchus ocellatus]|uniref:Reverse transcriptase domain-containing protein n=1 Tax=Plakobranchus ocellatus TaxID=259542 RepID=A0AAV4ADE0_9GAST|nr:hypothetical protein PoB_003107800 [Plakobranchus ocellatus]
MVNSFPHGTLHLYPNQGDPVTYSTLADGLPQGSALSCAFFMIFMSNIGNAVRTLTRLSYADDIVIWQQDISQDLTSLKRFCERWKMQIITGETAYATFSLP